MGKKQKPEININNDEEIRCKINIYDKENIIETIVLNIRNIHKTILDIENKYGNNTNFKIINLEDEKIIMSRYTPLKGADKDATDKEHYSRMFYKIKRIQDFIKDGKIATFIAPQSFIDDIINLDEDGIKLYLRKLYNNDSLGRKNDNINTYIEEEEICPTDQ